jgi:hypothetical protein
MHTIWRGEERREADGHVNIHTAIIHHIFMGTSAFISYMVTAAKIKHSSMTRPSQPTSI